MKIKYKNFEATTLNRFDLLGYDEIGLSKAFAYLLACESSIFYRFVQHLGVKTKHTRSNFKDVKIDIERKRNEGRTDIEIHHPGKFHIIIECKIGANHIKKQRRQYLPSFESEPVKVLCFITKERECNLEISSGVSIHYKGWLDIIDLVDKKDFDRSSIVKEFISYAVKGFKMRDQKEVLIQDLSDPAEIKRYINNCLYRRDITFGSPLYFAPYFTRGATNIEGITQISKVLGVLTISKTDVMSFKDELLVYADGDDQLVNKWIAGVISNKSKQLATFYFLSYPVSLNNSLLKDGGREKGRGKGWIAAMIPKNRCVSFEEFIRRMVQAENNG